MTVLQSIEKDALEYKANDVEYYTKAQALHAQTSDYDDHKYVIETLWNVSNQGLSRLEARVTYSTTCSRNWTAL